MTSLWKTHAETVTDHPWAEGHHDVVVVGAGLTGLTAGLLLVRAGLGVAIVEAGEVGNLATGSNTGKLTLLQGSVLSRLRANHSASLVRAYVDANRDGAEWLTAFADEAGVPYERRTAVSFAQTATGIPVVDDELAAAREAGLPVERAHTLAAASPFPVAAAIELRDQVAIDPQRVAIALARAFVAAGGILHTQTRVSRVRTLPHPGVDTARGPLSSDHVVLATGTPIDDRGLYFAKTHGLRSYAVAFTVGGTVPDGMLISVDPSDAAPTRSLRPLTPADGPAASAQLIVGGNGHPVGRVDDERARVDDLVAWTQRHFSGAAAVADWSAQDYESHNLVPFVGSLPRGLGRIQFATGYAKWGLSNAPAAAQRIAAEVLGEAWRDRPGWMVKFGTRMTVPADLVRGAGENAAVGREAVEGWVGAQRHPAPAAKPAEGEGVVVSQAGMPVGISTVGGRTRAVSAVCPHLGGVLRWNDAECTWDCPLHASRFAADGTRIEGPAVRDLRRRPRREGEPIPPEPDGFEPGESR